MISLFPIRTQTNNGILSGNRAMPQKNITSNNDSNFSNNRHAYIESYLAVQNPPLVKNDKHTIQESTVNNSVFGHREMSINHNYSNQASTIQKKWIGGNRDASDIISKRRINSVGNGSLNASGKPISFDTVVDHNTERQAYHRVRSGGSAVPAKCTNKYANAPIFH